MCQELEPERRLDLPSEAWNASVDTEAPHQRYRADSDLSIETVASPSVKVPEFRVPRWSWPESRQAATHAPISEPIKP